MKISVVIPMYNSESTIIRTLNSVKNQTAIKNVLELIVINDGSKDNSLEVVRKYKNENPKVPIIIINQSNSGVSAARNKGMKNANGDWIAFLDSDDEWLPYKLQVQTDVIKKNSDIDFLGGPFNEKVLRIFTKKIDRLYKAKVNDICIRNFPQPSTVIFKKKVYDEIGGFDETQKYAEDGNYFLKICGKYNLYYLPQLLIIYDNGKRGFGTNGLSANLKKMYEGNKKNIRELHIRNQITYPFFIFLQIYYYAKYIRRIFITSINK